MENKMTKTEHIKRLLDKRPDLTMREIAKRTTADVSLVYEVRKNVNKAIAQSKGEKLPNIVSNVTTGKSKAKDNVPLFIEKKAEIKPQVNENNSPSPAQIYSKAVDMISVYGLNFNLGSAVAHTLSANKGNNRDADLKAAIWYLEKELSHTNKH